MDNIYPTKEEFHNAAEDNMIRNHAEFYEI